MTQSNESTRPPDELGAALRGVETDLAYTLVRLAIENQRAEFDALVDASGWPLAQMDEVWTIVRRVMDGQAGPTPG